MILGLDLKERKVAENRPLRIDNGLWPSPTTTKRNDRARPTRDNSSGSYTRRVRSTTLMTSTDARKTMMAIVRILIHIVCSSNAVNNIHRQARKRLHRPADGLPVSRPTPTSTYRLPCYRPTGRQPSLRPTRPTLHPKRLALPGRPCQPSNRQRLSFHPRQPPRSRLW